MKISIIGAGNVGGLTASHLCCLGFDEIVLVDIMPNLAYAKALDLSDARFLFRQNYHITGTDDIKHIANSEIVIITAGIARKPGMKREELIQKNSQIIKRVCQDIRRFCSNSIIIVVTNPLDAMTYLAIKESGFPVRKVMGMGLTLDMARLANLIAEALDIPVMEIGPCIIASHGEGMLPLSRYTKVKGQPLEKYLEPSRIRDLFNKTIKRGGEIVSLLKEGSAYFAPATAISELVRAVARDEKRILPVSVYINGEYGIKDICIGLPCRLGKNGIEEIVRLELNDEEKAAFLRAAGDIKNQISNIKY